MYVLHLYTLYMYNWIYKIENTTYIIYNSTINEIKNLRDNFFKELKKIDYCLILHYILHIC